jgi:hypothetical protein
LFGFNDVFQLKLVLSLFRHYGFGMLFIFFSTLCPLFKFKIKRQKKKEKARRNLNNTLNLNPLLKSVFVKKILLIPPARFSPHYELAILEES